MDSTRNKNTDTNYFHVLAETWLSRFNLPMIKDKPNAEIFVETLDQGLDILIPSIPEKEKEKAFGMYIMLIGSTLGEMFKIIFNGDWYFSEKQNRWVISVKNKNGEETELNVFNKIEKRFLNGDEDSIKYYYDNIKRI